MTLASLIFSGRDWLLPVLVLAGLGLAALVWGYTRAAADKGLRVTCALLKVLGFAISFALFTFFVVAHLYRQPVKTALLISIGSSLGFYLVFALALNVSLPTGLLGF